MNKIVLPKNQTVMEALAELEQWLHNNLTLQEAQQLKKIKRDDGVYKYFGFEARCLISRMPRNNLVCNEDAGELIDHYMNRKLQETA